MSRKTHRQTVSASAVNLLRQKRKKHTLAETLQLIDHELISGLDEPIREFKKIALWIGEGHVASADSPGPLLQWEKLW